MATRIRRIGWRWQEYAEAEAIVAELGNGTERNGVWHLVEVYDEGLHKLPGGEEGGVAYVVPDEELEAFTERHDGDCGVKATAGWTDAEWDEILAGQS